jgi:hypothetical protein
MARSRSGGTPANPDELQTEPDDPEQVEASMTEGEPLASPAAEPRASPGTETAGAIAEQANRPTPVRPQHLPQGEPISGQSIANLMRFRRRTRAAR